MSEHMESAQQGSGDSPIFEAAVKPAPPIEEESMPVRFKVFRGDPSGGEMRDYTVPAGPGMVVLDAMHWIQANQDGDLAVRWNCKAAKCGSCSAEINGVPRLMCKTRIDALGDSPTSGSSR